MPFLTKSGAETQADGSVVVPTALRPFMNGLEVIKPA